MTYTDDKYLRTLLSNRSDQAVDAISEAYGKLIFQLAYRITGSREDSDEIVSDTLLEIWNTPEDRINMPLMSFACMIARHRAIDRVRKHNAKRRNGTFVQAQTELFSDFNETGITDSMVISAVVNGFLRSLSSDDRYIFMRRYFEYATCREIASELHIKTGTVEVKLHRMRKDFQERLQKQGITV